MLDIKTNIKAIKTTEGFIEIIALEELDDIVGGLLDPESIFCELEEDPAVSVR